MRKINSLSQYVIVFLFLMCSNPVCAQNTLSDAIKYYSNKQYDKAIPMIKTLAEEGNATAQTILGISYQMGYGVETDNVKAMYWLNLAATQGNAHAQSSLAANYYTGKGIAVNYEEAFKWSDKAAKQNDKHGQYVLAECLYHGYGTDKNLVQAAFWYQKSAEQGFDKAQYMLGMCYSTGEGVTYDDEKRVYWFNKAADQGNSDAQFQLGCFYYWTVSDYDKAFHWFTKASENGDKAADYFLGSCYEDGLGVSKDISKAFSHYSKAAKNGNTSAHYCIGLFYKKGLGTTKNDNEAFKHFKLAAEDEHWSARLLLSVCYYYGVGTAPDHNKAAKWYKLAADSDKDGAEAEFKTTCEEWHLAYKSDLAQLYRKQNNTQEDSSTPTEFVIDNTIDVNIPQVTGTQSNSFAVIIGNENYQKVTKVEFANNDAQIFAQYCKKTLGMPEKNVRFYADATYATMLAAIEDIKSIAKAYKGDLNVVFYYAGHGIPNESSNDAFLLPIDTDGRNTAVCHSLSKLYQELGSMNAKSVVVFMDACFSGSQRGEGMLASARGVAIKAKPASPQGNMVVFSAASGDETAYPYKEKGHGLFTYFLLKKLQETKGAVTLEELGSYIIDNVTKESVVSNGKSQTPTISPSTSLYDSWKSLKLK